MFVFAWRSTSEFYTLIGQLFFSETYSSIWSKVNVSKWRHRYKNTDFLRPLSRPLDFLEAHFYPENSFLRDVKLPGRPRSDEGSSYAEIPPSTKWFRLKSLCISFLFGWISRTTISSSLGTSHIDEISPFDFFPGCIIYDGDLFDFDIGSNDIHVRITNFRFQWVE